MIQDGCNVNLGDLLCSYRLFKAVSMMIQAIKGECHQMTQQKSDCLIVLRVWESHAQGEAGSIEMIS